MGSMRKIRVPDVLRSDEQEKKAATSSGVTKSSRIVLDAVRPHVSEQDDAVTLVALQIISFALQIIRER